MVCSEKDVLSSYRRVVAVDFLYPCGWQHIALLLVIRPSSMRRLHSAILLRVPVEVLLGAGATDGWWTVARGYCGPVGQGDFDIQVVTSSGQSLSATIHDVKIPPDVSARKKWCLH